MGLIMMPEQTYKCSKCGSENCEEYIREKPGKFSGHYEGVKCLECGHKKETYEPSLWEKMSESGQTYEYNPNEPIEF